MLGVGAARAGELSFDEAQRLALAGAPTLVAAAARSEASRQELRPAGELPDPRLALGVDNLPIEGRGRYGFSDEPMAMRRIALSQAFPNGDKRRWRRARSTCRRRRRRSRACAFKSKPRWPGSIATRPSGSSRASTPCGRKAACSPPPCGRALRVDRVPPSMPSRASLAGGVTDWPVDVEHLRQHLPHHPELAVYAARAEVVLARAARHPDWGLAVAYQQRDRQFGDMVSLEVSVDLPLLPGRRQDPLIAARVADGEALAAREDALLREHRTVLEARLAEYQRLERALTRQTGTLLPLADEKVALALAAWRSGEGSLADLITARRERIDADVERIDLEGQRQQAAARLHFAYDADSAGKQP